MNMQNTGQTVTEEIVFNSASTKSPYTSTSGDTALGRLTFIVTGDVYKAKESPWDYLCSDSLRQAIYISTSSQEEALQKEFQAWDAASDEIHGE